MKMTISVKEGRGKSAIFHDEEVDGHIFPDSTAKTLIVKHLGGEISIQELFTEKVFTPELLKELDEKAIKPTFSLPDIHSLEELAEIEKELFTDEELSDEDEKD